MYFSESKSKLLDGHTNIDTKYRFHTYNLPAVYYPNGTVITLENKIPITSEQIPNFTFNDFEKYCNQFFNDPDCKTVFVSLAIFDLISREVKF